jgi:hypothetical protein
VGWGGGRTGQKLLSRMYYTASYDGGVELWSKFLEASRLTTGICVFRFLIFCSVSHRYSGTRSTLFFSSIFLPHTLFTLDYSPWHNRFNSHTSYLPYLAQLHPSPQFQPSFPKRSSQHRIARWDQNVQLFQKFLHL